MDSLTQVVLGAAVGEILLGRQLGNKALLLGAIGGTLPDMDVIYNFFSTDPIRQLEVHRSYSHSMFTHLVLAYPFAYFSKRWSNKSISIGKWYLFWFLAFFTHALLDCCTTYGTQLFLPLTNYQVAFNNISVIDPLYTIPFLILLTVCMFYEKTSSVRRNFLWLSVIVSSVYMLFTFGIKAIVHEKFKNSLVENKIHFNELNSTPTMLNSVLWCAIAYDDSMLYTSEYSFLKKNDSIKWVPFIRNLSYLNTYDSKSLETITWFSDGNYFIQPLASDTIAFYNVKWGRMKFDSTEPDKAFFFYWKFYVEDHEIKYKEVRNDDWKIAEAFSMLISRIGI